MVLKVRERSAVTGGHLSDWLGEGSNTFHSHDLDGQDTSTTGVTGAQLASLQHQVLDRRVTKYSS